MSSKKKVAPKTKKKAKAPRGLKPEPHKFYVTKNGSVVLVHHVARTFGGEKHDPQWESDDACATVIRGGHGNAGFHGFAPGSGFYVNAKTGRAGASEDGPETLKVMSPLSLVRLAAVADLGL